MNEKRISPLILIGRCLAVILGVLLIVSVAQARSASDTPEPAAAIQNTNLYLPVSLAGYPTAWTADSIFGTQMYNDSREISRHYNDLVDSGATWLRIAVHWKQIEAENTTPDNYNWRHGDYVFAAAATDTDIRIIGTIEDAPDWAIDDPMKSDGPIKPENVPDFLEFVAELVERYDGDGFKDAPGSPVVDYWEIYNEPDKKLTVHDGRWGNHATEYSELLSAIYPVIKARSPNAKVVLGGLAYDWFEDQNGPFVRSFLDDVLAHGNGENFDIFNFHAYPSFNINWTPGHSRDMGPGLLQKAQFLRNKLSAAGINKPMIITEAGWHSNNDPIHHSNEEIQSRYVVQLYTQSLAADLDVMIWWLLYDAVGHGNENGLVTIDNPPRRKLAFTAHQAIVNMLTDKPFVRALSPGELNNNPSLEAYEFNNPATGRALYVAWLNPVDHGNTTTLTLAAEEVRRFDIYGAQLSSILDEQDGVDDGRVKVPVGAQPVYIEVVR